MNGIYADVQINIWLKLYDLKDQTVSNFIWWFLRPGWQALAAPCWPDRVGGLLALASSALANTSVCCLRHFAQKRAETCTKYHKKWSYDNLWNTRWILKLVSHREAMWTIYGNSWCCTSVGKNWQFHVGLQAHGLQLRWDALPGSVSIRSSLQSRISKTFLHPFTFQYISHSTQIQQSHSGASHNSNILHITPTGQALWPHCLRPVGDLL